jgi:hypothetical protein
MRGIVVISGDFARISSVAESCDLSQRLRLMESKHKWRSCSGPFDALIGEAAHDWHTVPHHVIAFLLPSRYNVWRLGRNMNRC